MRRRWLGLIAAILLITVLTVAWDRQDHAHWTKLVWWPFGAGVVRPLDLLGNVALYMPLGLTMPARSLRWRLIAGTLVAAGLSLTFELTQVFSHERIPSLLDVGMNVVGALAGAAIAQPRAPQHAKAAE